MWRSLPTENSVGLGDRDVPTSDRGLSDFAGARGKYFRPQLRTRARRRVFLVVPNEPRNDSFGEFLRAKVPAQLGHKARGPHD